MAIINLIKNFLRPTVLRWFRYEDCIRRMKLFHRSDSNSRMWIKSKIVMSNLKLSREEDYVRQMSKAFRKVSIQSDGYYIYPYDCWVYREIPPTFKLICSITADFDVILKSNLNELSSRFEKAENKSFANTECKLIKDIGLFGKKIATSLRKGHSDRSTILKGYFPVMLYRNPLSFDEAIQKILFYDAIFWQANHWHVGLGRLDKILYSYYISDIKKGVLNRDTAKDMLLNLCKVLGRDTSFKSKAFLGDTGQYILLGGTDENGEQIDNELTELFLEIFKDYQHTDPKLILRISDDTPDTIWQKAISCVCSGYGSPLFMNERPIMNNMLKFGYQKEDLCNLGTSACWEPLIIGKSFDQNNALPSIISLKPLTNLLKKTSSASDFGNFLQDYKHELSSYISSCIYDIKYDCSPLFSLFFDDCLKTGKDFTEGGARYAYHGIQVVSFPNTINALVNIKKYVFEQKLFSLDDCKDIISNNYEGHEDALLLFKQNGLKFGSSNSLVIDLTNDLMDFVGKEVAKHTMNGKPLKVGFSSPNYISSCNGVEASLDGRKADEPFAVHISPLSSNIDISEIMDFASKLDYDANRINGNVVDFTIPSSYIKNQDKLVSLIKNACEKGMFELQLNVLNYQQLVNAKKHPEKYPNLIVRVWGFSAYFNDLPEAYKDNLIARAKLYEAA